MASRNTIRGLALAMIVICAAFLMAGVSLAGAARGTPTGCKVPIDGVVYGVHTTKPWVSVTFDDGPYPQFTPGIIHTFDRFGMAGTFFVIGKQVAAYPDAAREILAHGNEIGDHSYTHPELPTTADHGFAELSRAAHTIESVTGFRPCLARPPDGSYDSGVVAAARRLGLTMVLWKHSTSWRNEDASSAVRYALRGIRPGRIILLHDWNPGNRIGLHLILRGLERRGLRSVPVTKLLGGHFHR